MDVCVLTIYFLLVLEEGADSSMSSVCQSGNLITCQFYSSWKCGGILSLYFFFFFFLSIFLPLHYKVLTLCIMCPGPRSIHFSMEHFFPLMDDDIRDVTFSQLNILMIFSCHCRFLYCTMTCFYF